jgi:hypothetical protein
VRQGRLSPGGLGHQVQGLTLGLAKRVGQFFRKKFLAGFQVFPVSGAQSFILFPNSQAFVYFCISTRIAFVHHRLMGVGPRFPLIADFCFPGFHVLQELCCPGRANRWPDGAVETVFTNHQGDLFALEKDFCKSGAVLAGKTSFADGLNSADAVVGVMDAIALGYGDNFLLDLFWMIKKKTHKKHYLT